MLADFFFCTTNVGVCALEELDIFERDSSLLDLIPRALFVVVHRDHEVHEFAFVFRADRN